MRICDRCIKEDKHEPAVKELTTSSHESFDLCVTCFDKVIDLIGNPKTKKVDSPKRTTTRRKRTK